jgi:hypothetical protein
MDNTLPQVPLSVREADMKKKRIADIVQIDKFLQLLNTVEKKNNV